MRLSTNLPAVILTMVCAVTAAGAGAQTLPVPYETVDIPQETPAQRMTREAEEARRQYEFTHYTSTPSNASSHGPKGPGRSHHRSRSRYRDRDDSSSLKAAVADDAGALVATEGGGEGQCAQAASAAYEATGRFLYTEGVCGFRIDQVSGALTAIPGSPFPLAAGTNGVGAVATDPTGRFLFQVNEDNDSVTAYRIDPQTGAPTVVPGSPFPAGVFPVAALVEASARFLYVVNNALRNDVPSSISGYAIDPATGALSPLPGSPYAAPSNALHIATDPLGKFVYLAGSKLSAYAIDAATGALAPIGVQFETGGGGLAVDPSGRFLYMSVAGVTQGINGFAIGAGGALTPLGPTMATADYPGRLGVSVSGRYLYVVNLLAENIGGYRIAWDTGALAPIPGSPFSAPASPLAIATGGYMPSVDFADVGYHYANRIAAYGGKPPYQRTIVGGTLPPGMVLDAPTGMIHGTPTATGTFSFTVEVSDRVPQTARSAYSIVVAPSGQTTGSGNYQGLWWRSPEGSEAGWGINFAHQGDILFATWFTYDAGGKPVWLAAVLNRTATGVYAGDLFTTTGPAFSASPWDGSTVVETTVGTATVTFADDDNGSFAYTFNGVSQQKPITRQVFAGAAAACTWGGAPDLALATNYQDLWWKFPANSEPGWGVNFTHQADLIFATWFTYGANGKPLWLIAVAQLQADTGNVYAGPVSTVTGPAFSTVPWDPATVVETEVGSATITFADGNRATFATSVNGVTQAKEITRQVFAAPGTVCQ